MTDLGTLGSGSSSSAADINDLGQVVGDANSHAFFWSSTGGMQDLGTFGGNGARAVAINNSGQVVGTASTWTLYPFYGLRLTAEHAFLWDATGGGRLLGQLAGDVASRATDIDDAGQVVGVSGAIANPLYYPRLAQFLYHEDFLWQSGTMSGLGFPSSDPSINNNSQVVGGNTLW